MGSKRDRGRGKDKRGREDGKCGERREKGINYLEST